MFHSVSKTVSDTDIVVQCKKKHVTVCPEFTETGSCPRGRRCPLRHIAKKRRLLDVSTPAKTEHNAAGYGSMSPSYTVFNPLRAH